MEMIRKRTEAVNTARFFFGLWNLDPNPRDEEYQYQLLPFCKQEFQVPWQHFLVRFESQDAVDSVFRIYHSLYSERLR